MKPSSVRRAVATAAIAALSAAALLAFPLSASAADIVVTSSDDTNTPGTLRYAIENSDAGDTITFAPSVTEITVTEILFIEHSLNIIGPGSGLLSLSRVASGNYHVFGFAPTVENTDLTISGLTITGGDGDYGVGISLSGSGIDFCDVVLDDIVVNDQNYSGGAAVYAFALGGDLTIRNSSFERNETTHEGGAVYIGNNGGAVSIENSYFGQNSGSAGGAVYVNGAFGDATVDSSTFEQNTATTDAGALWFGAISEDTTFSITDSGFSDNSADGRGGAAYVENTGDGSLAVSESSFTDNAADNEGGALDIDFVGAGTPSAVIESSTFASNVADRGSSIGVGVINSLLEFTNVTIYDALSASGAAQAVYISTLDGTVDEVALEVQSSTVIGNGAFIVNDNQTGNILIENSVLQSSTDLEPGFAVLEPSEQLVTVNYDLISNEEEAYYATGTGNLFEGSASFSTSSNTGSDRLVLYPSEGDDVIDAGDPAYVGPSFDARGAGFDRIVNGRVDIGAVEYNAPFFADVTDTASPFYNYIQWMYNTSISTGTPQATGKPIYNPTATVSRQAMAAFLFRLDDPFFLAPTEPTFADVATSSPFYTQIEWMADQGISTGTPQPSGKPLYKPADPVSRQAMALFLARFAEADLSVPPTVQSFADVPINSSPAAAIEWMKNNGVSTGTPQPSGLPLYQPADPVSRQAMAAFLYRIR